MFRGKSLATLSGRTVFALYGAFTFALGAVAVEALAASAHDSFWRDNQTAMSRMMTAMDVRSSGDVDLDFVAMMIPHHAGAIDMAKLELRYGHTVALKRLAQEIIVTQQSEIDAMRLALGDARTSGSSR